MTDTLTVLSTPTTVVKNRAGTSLYTIGSGVANVKYAIATNNAPWDAYLTLGVNDLTVLANRTIPSLLVPAFKSVKVPLDLIVSQAAGDIVKARQSIPYQDIYGSTSELQTPGAAPTNGTGNAGSAASVVTGSWTEVSGTLYLLTVAWKKSTGAGTLDSFTDTHSGITWTLLDSVASADGTQKLAAYSAVSSGTTAATTTATFNTTQDGSALAVVNVALVGTFDNTTANGVDGIVSYGTAEDTRSDATPYLPIGTRHTYSNRIVTTAMYGTATTHTAATGWTELNDVGANQTLNNSYMLGTGTGVSGIYLPTLAAASGLTLGLGVEVQQRPRPLSVSLYGVVVT